MGPAAGQFTGRLNRNTENSDMVFPVGITLPFDTIDPPQEFGTIEAVREVGQAIEQAGFNTGTVTDHPAPSSRWLDAGGHYAQDPFVMLSLVAAATTTLRLQTSIVVLPYRNPFVTARAVSSLDVYSNGRVSLGIGTGYLKAEYKALGVEFDNRNALTDEYIRAMKLAWTGEDFEFEGTGYTALGNRIRPVPLQKPHPPILIGGNSRLAIRRAVELGDYWAPFFAPPGVLAMARTASIAEEEDVDAALSYLNAHCEKVGREVPPKLYFAGTGAFSQGYNAQEFIDRIGGLRAKGASAVGVNISAGNRAQWCDLARDFGANVLAKLD
jgi:probable F420-dependent oxidoreductase